jgi:hypothetical protein
MWSRRAIDVPEVTASIVSCRRDEGSLRITLRLDSTFPTALSLLRAECECKKTVYRHCASNSSVALLDMGMEPTWVEVSSCSATLHAQPVPALRLGSTVGHELSLDFPWDKISWYKTKKGDYNRGIRGDPNRVYDLPPQPEDSVEVRLLWRDNEKRRFRGWTTAKIDVGDELKM